MQQFICSGSASRTVRSWRSIGRRLALAVFASFAVSSATHAVSIDWNNSSGDGRWNNPANWSAGIVPSGGDDAAFIDLTRGVAMISEDIPTLRDFRFGDDGRTGGGQVDHTAGNAILNGW